MLLADLPWQGDFAARVQDLALAARRRLGLDRPVHQLGVVVPDVVAAAEELEGQGLAPFLLVGGPARRWAEGGQERPMRSRLGFGSHQGIEIELLEPGSGTDFYRRSLDAAGRPVLQHLGFLVGDVDAAARALAVPITVRGRIGFGPLRIDFAYLDTEREAGLILELIGHRLLGLRCRPPARLQRLAGRLRKRWHKRRCLEL
jgi:hypothetical protein